jgi:outer membrane protein TolC
MIKAGWARGAAWGVAAAVLLAAGRADGAEPPPARPMTLGEVVAAAVASSRAIRDARLARDSDRLDRKVAEREFTPDLELAAAVARARKQTYPESAAESLAASDAATGSAVLRQAIPTGGQLAFTWDTSSTSATGNANAPLDADHARGWQVALVQPLLRGGGTGVGTADLRIARLNDRKSALELGRRAMAVITDAVLAYRDLARAGEELAIARAALDEANRLAEMNRALIDAGRMAPVDLVQNDTEVANREVDVLVAENRLDAARLALVDVLDVPVDTVIEPVTSVQPAVATPELAVVQALALERRPEVLSARLDLEIANTNLAVTANDRLPVLDLAAGYGGTVDRPALLDNAFRDHGWTTGLTLGYTFGDTARGVRHQQARIAVERGEVAIREIEDGIRLEVAGRVREVRNAALAADLARRARELSEKQLGIEAEKLKVGRSSNFEYLRLENDLVAARNRELAANVSYLDALTLLDQSVGTTLDTWGVTVEAPATEAP